MPSLFRRCKDALFQNPSRAPSRSRRHPRPSIPSTLEASLPTRSRWVRNHFEVLAECSICFERFDHRGHAPARLTGQNSCSHIFGSSCLRRWVESDHENANKCPSCRRVLFRRGRDTEESSIGYAQEIVPPSSVSGPSRESHPGNNEDNGRDDTLVRPPVPSSDTQLPMPLGAQPASFADSAEEQIHVFTRPGGFEPVIASFPGPHVVYSNLPFSYYGEFVLEDGDPFPRTEPKPSEEHQGVWEGYLQRLQEQYENQSDDSDALS
jgi:hypothetical protein